MLNKIIDLYKKFGYKVTHLEDGVIYVQKQKTTGDCEIVSMPTLRVHGRDSCSESQQSDQGWQGKGNQGK